MSHLETSTTALNSEHDDRPRRRRRSDAERNTRRIVEAAMRVLSSDPRASMQTVAHESGLGRATVYRHFPTRDVLAGAIYRQSLDDAEEAIRHAAEGASDTHEALLRVTQALVRNGERYRMVVSRAGIDPVMRSREEEVGAMLTALIERGQSEGLLRRDLTSRWLTGTYSATLLHGIRRQDELQLDEDRMAELIVGTWIEGGRAR